MNASELAAKLLEWEQKRKELDILESEIRKAILAAGKSQTVGNVQARYTGGRVVYDYQSVGQSAPMKLIELHTAQVIDWKGVCDEAGLEAPVKSRSDPSVTIKLVE